ncbi:serine/threonine-protein kinase Warts-like isoform X2 [Lineus longissimus]|uniref:serine/threonine-protein kinase Warts-like isoform X2 n=1 Tax=Lineus longissimus TaxID=88925 RepID=UPI00315CA132
MNNYPAYLFHRDGTAAEKPVGGPPETPEALQASQSPTPSQGKPEGSPEAVVSSADSPPPSVVTVPSPISTTLLEKTKAQSIYGGNLGFLGAGHSGIRPRVRVGPVKGILPSYSPQPKAANYIYAYRPLTYSPGAGSNMSLTPSPGVDYSPYESREAAPGYQQYVQSVPYYQYAAAYAQAQAHAQAQAQQQGMPGYLPYSLPASAALAYQTAALQQQQQQQQQQQLQPAPSAYQLPPGYQAQAQAHAARMAYAPQVAGLSPYASSQGIGASSLPQYMYAPMMGAGANPALYGSVVPGQAAASIYNPYQPIQPQED